MFSRLAVVSHDISLFILQLLPILLYLSIFDEKSQHRDYAANWKRDVASGMVNRLVDVSVVVLLSFLGFKVDLEVI